jgi:hypothetical protein
VAKQGPGETDLHQGNWYVLVIGLPQPEAPLTLAPGIALVLQAEDMRGLLRSQPEQAREALQALLADRVECTPCSSPAPAGTRSPPTAPSVGCWRQPLAHHLWWPQRDVTG